MARRTRPGQQAEREAERGRPGAEDQIKRRAEDQVDLGNADRMMRQDLEESEDERKSRVRPLRAASEAAPPSLRIVSSAILAASPKEAAAVA
jgi:hypothetical protein